MYKAVYCIKSAFTLGKSLPYILGASCSFLFAYMNAGPKTLKWNVIATCARCLTDQTIKITIKSGGIKIFLLKTFNIKIICQF